MSAILPIDAAQRTAALDTAISFCVTAPAGSGKTELLSQRVLALLSQVQQPEEVLAITFTRKAAAEMHERILNALRAAQQAEPLEAHKRETWKLAHSALLHAENLNWNLLQNPQRLRVQTIDGFCSSLTGQMPVLSQFGAQPRITERAAPLYREAIDALLECLERNDLLADDLAALLLHVDNRVERLHELLASLLACRDQWLPHIGSGISADAAREHLETTLRSVRTDALQTLQQSFYLYQGELVPLLDFAAQRLRESQPEHALVRFAGCVELPGADSADVEAWRCIAELLLKKDGDWRRQVDKRCGFPVGEKKAEDGRDQKADYQRRKQAMHALLETLALDDELHAALTDVLHLPAANYPDTQWQMLVQLTRVLARAVAQLQLVFQIRGEVDFTEISLCALRALGSALNPSELMLRLDNRIRHLLIDEFQDTSTTQYRLLERLVEGWREHNETGAAPQTLFIVGDGMQSIYGFREAKVGLFLEARTQGVNQLPLRAAPLSVNFRSTPTIVEWVNRVFEQAFPQRDHIARGAVSYEPSHAFNAEPSHSKVAIYGVRNDPQRTAEADQCVALVQQALRGDSMGTIAILVRGRAHLRAIVPALQRANIAFRATDIDPLIQRAHVQDLLTLLRVLLDSVDTISLLALLRSPLVGLDNRNLHALVVGANRAPGVLACMRDMAVRAALDIEAARRIEYVVAVLDHAWAERGRKSLRSWLEGVWVALGGDLLSADASAWSDEQVLLELIEKSAAAADFDFELLEQQLQTLYARTDQQSDTRVLLMTIHKSKGLEFDTVIVPALDAGSRSDDKPLLRWSEYLAEDGKLGMVLSVKSALGEQDATYDWLDYEHKQKQALEDTRLLYVAATRAIKRLYLLFRTPNEQEFKSPPAHSLLRKIWAAVASDVIWIDGATAPVESESITSKLLQRVPLTWQQSMPLYLSAAADAANPPQLVASSLEITVGNVVHKILEAVTRYGAQFWRNASSAEKSLKVAQLLNQQGIAGADIDVATGTIVQTLESMLADTRGNWLLRGEHQESVCEWELLTADGKRFVIDRSFVENGARWIVDYKSSLPYTGESITAFAQRELNSYRAQLQNYRELVRAFDARPIRLALYFPRIAHWLELND
jgi:ATP-dependent exoDNAse (exonuclease V) beta subunit